MLAGSVAAALVGAVAVTAFVRGGPPERERYYQAGIAEPTTTGSIELRH